jgi:hypothetical protein
MPMTLREQDLLRFQRYLKFEPTERGSIWLVHICGSALGTPTAHRSLRRLGSLIDSGRYTIAQLIGILGPECADTNDLFRMGLLDDEPVASRSYTLRTSR